MPTQNDVHVDKLLGDVSVAVIQEATNFIAGQVFVDKPVAKQSDKYAVIPPGDFHRDDMAIRADATESAGANWRVSTDAYFCDVWALHHDIGDQTRSNADSDFELNSNTTRFLTHKALLRKEKIFTETALATGVWTNESAALNWSGASSTPISDVRDASRTMQTTSGYRPNKAVMTRDVYDALLDHPDFLARVANGAQSGAPGVSAAQVSRKIIAEMFEVDEILVMDSIENTAAEDVTPSNAFFASETMLLIYVSPIAGLGVPTAGYTFSWSGFLGQAGMGVRMKNFRMEELEADRLEIQMAFDMKVVAPDLGYLLTGLLS